MQDLVVHSERSSIFVFDNNDITLTFITLFIETVQNEQMRASSARAAKLA